jgi:hypothetical protein
VHCTYHGHNSSYKVHNGNILTTVYHSYNQLSRTLKAVAGHGFELIRSECHKILVPVQGKKHLKSGPVSAMCQCALPFGRMD